MKYLFSFILLSLCYITTIAQTQTWLQKQSLGYDVPSRYGAGMTSLNGKLYILGGSSTTASRMYNFTEYDPITGGYRSLAPLAASSGNICVTMGGKIYGIASNSYMQEYNFATDTWLPRAANLFAGFNIVSSSAAAFVINDSLFIISELSNGFYSYNPTTNTWHQKANYPGANRRRGAMAFAINGKGYMGGGTSSISASYAGLTGDFLQDFYEYDPAADIWTAKASLPEARKNGVAIGYSGKGYLGMGYDITGAISQSQGILSSRWYEYNPIANNWTAKASPTVISGLGVIANINDDLYVFSGSGNSYGYTSVNYNFNSKYNVTSNSWATNQLQAGGNRVEAPGFYLNNKLYSGGGHDGQSLTDFYEYDIAANIWAPKAPVPTTHTQRATANVNGKGYVIGGYDKNLSALGAGAYTDTVFAYDPVTNTWSTKANFPGGKRRDMVAFALGIKICAGLGAISGGGTSTAFYEFNTAINTWAPMAACPITVAGGMDAFSFSIADTGYVYSSSSKELYAYTANNNSWVQKASSPVAAGLGCQINQAFAYGNKGYVFLNGSPGLLYEYNAATNSWRLVTEFTQRYPTIIQDPEGAYFAFGLTGTGYANGETVSNQLWHLDMEAPVSTTLAVDTGCLGNTYSGFTASDTAGGLFAAFTGAATVCYAVNSITPLPYRTVCGNFGNSVNESGMFLNKSILINGSITNNGTLRLYYTTAELNAFVQAFNTQNGTNKTIDSIKILQYSYPLPGFDNNPLNNTGPPSAFLLRNPSFLNYGADKYVEFTSTNNAPIYGEIYAVLFTPAPVATISGPTAVCTGSSITLTASGGGTYSWSNSLGTSAGVNVSPTVGTTYSVSVSLPNNLCTSTATKTVTINALPTGSITGTSTICNGSSTTLTASGGTSFNWSNSLGTGPSKTVSPSSTTTYAVTVTDANTCTATATKTVTVNTVAAAIGGATNVCAGSSVQLTASGGTYAWSNGLGPNAQVTVTPSTTTTYTVTVTNTGCTATATQTVTFNALPTASITGTATICNGTSTTLTAAGGTGFNWSNSLGTAAVQTVSPTVATTYNVTVTDANTCTATATKTVTVNSVTAAINGPTTICSGSSAQLTATGGTYAWSNGLGTNAQVTVSPSVPTTYTVTVTNTGCTATASQTVQVAANPTATITGNTSVCAGSSTTLTANGGNTYTWANGLGTASDITVSPTTATIYTVTVSLGGNCTATASQAVSIKQVTTKQIAQTICPGTSFIFNGQTLTQGGAYNDTLINAAGCDSILTLNLTTQTPATGSTAQSICQGDAYIFNGQALTQDGTYTDTLVATNSCDSILTLTLTIVALPQPTVSQTNGVLSTQTFSSYQWLLNDAPINSATQQNYTATQNGDYAVVVTNAGNCSDTSSVVNITGVGIKLISTESLISIYPNPVTDVLTIASSTAYTNKPYTILNALGQQVLAGSITGTITNVDMHLLAAGLYLIKTGGEKPQTFKIIKQ